MNEILKVENLTKAYKDFKLDNISFELPKGCIMGLIGENGAGKSTTIHSILGVIKPDAGKITFWGKPLDGHDSIKEDIGVVFDGSNFYDTLTPDKIEKMLKPAYRQWDHQCFMHYMNVFELPLHKELKTFSKGMKMMFSITAALAHKPKLLILDEATSGLDPVKRDDLLDVFLDFVQDEDHSILMSSHITSDLEKVADYITFIHKGHMQLCCPKDELIYRYGIIRCGRDFYSRVDPGDILACRRMDYQWEILVADKENAAHKYKNVVVDDATIDEMMLIYVKGDQR